ncbi:class I SAM-dependent methyltransferase [bacterium]|nr:class I SAM-dependent methyltransferase [candidate division CSSED10-310 bacterium]
MNDVQSPATGAFQTPVTCRLCGSTDQIRKTQFTQLYSQYQKPYHRVDWWQCSTCKGMFAYPVPDIGTIIDHWKTINYNRAEDVPELHNARQRMLGLALADLRRRRVCGKILDIGSNYGYFLQEAAADGWTGFGFDPCDQGVARTRELGFDTRQGWELLEAGYPDHAFDAVTSFDAFCYVWHPYETLQEIRRILKPGGAVLMRLTNKRHIAQWTAQRMDPGERLNMKMTTLLQNQFHSIAIDDLCSVLRRLGFFRFRIIRRASTAPWSRMDRRSLIAYFGAESLYYLSLGRLNVSPGVIVSAQLNPGESD